MNRIEQLADQFCAAFYEKQWPDPGQPDLADLSVDDAYRVQELVAQRRQDRGEHVVGYKVGCTSAGIRQQFGLDQPIFGRLFSPHTTRSTDPVDWSRFANCAIEPEMVLLIGTDLSGHDLADDELIDAIEQVGFGIELHDYCFWHQPPTLQELICSGGIHAGLIHAKTAVEPRRLSYRDELFQVLCDGNKVLEGTSRQIMGGPLHALRWLVAALTREGHKLAAGSLVIPGSPVPLHRITADTEVTVRIEPVGQIVVPFQVQCD